MAEESMKDFEQELNDSFKTSKKVETEDMGKWDDLKEMMDNKTESDVKIIEVVKGGCVAYLNDIRGFIPASQLSTAYIEKLDEFQNKHIKVQIITVDPEKRRLVMSHRVIEQAENDAKKAELLKEIKEGDILTGKVESLKDYGAFIDLGGVSGLLHVSQISHTRIKNPAAVLKEGQEVRVKVIKTGDGKISLSMRALEPAPGEYGDSDSSDTDGFKYEEAGAATTSLGSILKGIKLS